MVLTMSGSLSTHQGYGEKDDQQEHFGSSVG